VGSQLNAKWAVRNRVYTNKTHLRGFQNFDLTLVRGGGLCLCSQATALGGSADLKQVARELHSPRLKLTRMSIDVPLRIGSELCQNEHVNQCC
jgi:hypothetical protein